MNKKNFISIFTGILLFTFTAASLSGNTGDVRHEPASVSVITGALFSSELHVDLGSSTLAAYGITIAYDAAVLTLNLVEAAPTGFVSAVNLAPPGTAMFSGFDTTGKGPSTDLVLCYLHWTAGEEGISEVNIAVDSLNDSAYQTIGSPRGIGALVTVTSVLSGDSNGDGNIDIIDALLVAQYYVGFNPEIILSASDVNCDGAVSIIDALLIAQYYVGLITSFPCGNTPAPTPTPTASPTPATATPSPSLPPANMLINGDFSLGSDPWDLFTDGAASISTVNGELLIRITDGGLNAWSVQLRQLNLKFETGKTYRMSFDARAQSPRTISVSAGRNSAPWTLYSGAKEIALTTAMSSYTFTFTMSSATDVAGRIAFDCGTSNSSVYIDNVSVTDISGPTPEPTPTPTAGPEDFSEADFQYSTVNMHESVILDKIKGGYIGQMAGVNWGCTTEFYAYYIWQSPYHQNLYPDLKKFTDNWLGRWIPEDELPIWKPEWINEGFGQDDLYVEVPFMDAMRTHGVNADWSLLGNAFRDTTFQLWHANNQGRTNLKNGIPAPASGHYSNNTHCDDLDWQIEADFTGLMNPGQVNSAIETAWRTGHVMNYGDGVYGGVFVAVMEAAAFTAGSVSDIIEAGRTALPVGSKYRAVVEDVIANHAAGMSWSANWEAIQTKWGETDRCPEMGAGGSESFLNIDAKINGAYILMGLLYGNGNFEDSMRIAMACGQDSDCNPSNVGSILGIYYGFSNLDSKWSRALDYSKLFVTTSYNINQMINLNLELAREVVVKKGGAAPSNGTWSIPAARTIIPPVLEQWPENGNNTLPQLNITAAVLSNRQVRFSATATDSDGIAGFQWFFGDLTYLKGTNGTHTYNAPGTYTATCYVTDSTGNTAWKQVNVTVQ